MTSRHYYALYAPYGTRTVYNEHHWPTVHQFDTQSARDAWVDDDPNPANPTREAVSASESSKYSQPERDVVHVTPAPIEIRVEGALWVNGSGWSYTEELDPTYVNSLDDLADVAAEYAEDFAAGFAPGEEQDYELRFYLEDEDEPRHAVWVSKYWPSDDDEPPRYTVTYQGGDSRQHPGQGIDYMLVKVPTDDEEIELYAEVVNPTWDAVRGVYDDETATYDELRLAILEQARERGIDPDSLVFPDDGESRFRVLPEHWDAWGSVSSNPAAYVVTKADIERLAYEWEMSVDDLMEQVEEV